MKPIPCEFRGWLVVVALLPMVNLAVTPTVRAQDETEAAETLQRILVTPGTGAPIRSSVPKFFLEGNAKSSKAHIEGGFRVAQHSDLGRLYATVGLTTPLADDEDEPTEFGGLDGLTSGTKLSLSITGQRWDWTNKGSEVQEWCEKKVKEGRTPKGYTRDSCENFDLTEVVGAGEEYDASLERAYYLETNEKEPLLYEISFSLQRKKMNYLDSLTFLPKSLTRGSGSVGASIGRFWGNYLWSVSYRYEVAYVPESSAEICLPEGSTGALRCRKGPLGEPAEEKSSVGIVQARGFVLRNLAVNPRFAYRFTDDDWGFELPIYFVPGENGLVGGVVSRYNSADKEWTFSVFFGKTFRVGL